MRGLLGLHQDLDQQIKSGRCESELLRIAQKGKNSNHVSRYVFLAHSYSLPHVCAEKGDCSLISFHTTERRQLWFRRKGVCAVAQAESGGKWKRGMGGCCLASLSSSSSLFSTPIISWGGGDSRQHPPFAPSLSLHVRDSFWEKGKKRQHRLLIQM